MLSEIVHRVNSTHTSVCVLIPMSTMESLESTICNNWLESKTLNYPWAHTYYKCVSGNRVYEEKGSLTHQCNLLLFP